MVMDANYIIHAEYDGRQQIIDERFCRDKERLDNVEKVQVEMVRLSARVTEILDRECEESKEMRGDISDMKQMITRFDDAFKHLISNDQDRETRIAKLEGEPKIKYDRLISYFISSGIGAIIVVLSNAIFK